MSETRPTWMRLLDLAKSFLAWWGTKEPEVPPTPPTPEPVPAPTETTGQALLRLHNEYRQANGIRPLAWHARLATLAKTHAETMARFEQMSHDVGGKFQDRLAADRSLKYRAAGENIASALTAESAFKAWLKSAPHLQSIVNRNFTGMAGATNSDGRFPGTYWCVIFIQEVTAGQFTVAGIVTYTPSGLWVEHGESHE